MTIRAVLDDLLQNKTLRMSERRFMDSPINVEIVSFHANAGH